jgi:hypothetical protein
MILVLGVWAFVRALLVSSAAVSLENVALRCQLVAMQRSVGSPPAPPAGPTLLGEALTAVGRLADPRHCSARDRPRLAPPGLPALLALEVPAPLNGSPAARS